MSAQANSTKQANLTKYTEEEILAIGKQCIALIQEGKEEEADILSLQVPIMPLSAEIEKNDIGIKALIATGVNLSDAVEEYGLQWLEE